MSPIRLLTRLAAAAVALCATTTGAWAQLNVAPRGTEGVGIVQRVGEAIPLDLTFTDHLGRAVRLGDYFHPGRPTLLTLNYGDCPMLCIVQLDGVVEVLNELEFDIGDDFQIVTVSIDPRESPAKARATRAHYLERYERADLLSDEDWPFLVGPQASIDALAGSLGFGFRFLPETGEFAHDAAMMLATSDGTIARYFFGIRYEPKVVRLSLVEASQGRLGGIVDQFSLLCFVYDHEQGVYTATAVTVMRIAGLLTVLILGGFLIGFWRKEILAALKGRSASRAGSSLEGVS
jgi:protein SCO1/2